MDGGLPSVFGTGDTTDATHVDDVVTTGGIGASFNLAMARGTALRLLMRKPLDILVVHLWYILVLCDRSIDFVVDCGDMKILPAISILLYLLFLYIYV